MLKKPVTNLFTKSLYQQGLFTVIARFGTATIIILLIFKVY